MTELDAACFSAEFLFGRALMQVLAERAHALTLIAETAEGEMVGFTIAHCDQEGAPGSAYLVTLNVRPDVQHQGIGGLLLAAAERQSCGGGAQQMELHVHTGNGAAIQFYERHGYLLRSRVRQFYGRGRADRDAFLYSKALEHMPAL